MSQFCVGKLQKRKWEQAREMDRYSWGFRRRARADDYLSINQLLSYLVRTVRWIDQVFSLWINVYGIYYCRIIVGDQCSWITLVTWIYVPVNIFQSKKWIVLHSNAKTSIPMKLHSNEPAWFWLCTYTGLTRMKMIQQYHINLREKCVL